MKFPLSAMKGSIITYAWKWDLSQKSNLPSSTYNGNAIPPNYAASQRAVLLVRVLLRAWIPVHIFSRARFIPRDKTRCPRWAMRRNTKWYKTSGHSFRLEFNLDFRRKHRDDGKRKIRREGKNSKVWRPPPADRTRPYYFCWLLSNPLNSLRDDSAKLLLLLCHPTSFA